MPRRTRSRSRSRSRRRRKARKSRKSRKSGSRPRRRRRLSRGGNGERYLSFGIREELSQSRRRTRKDCEREVTRASSKCRTAPLRDRRKCEKAVKQAQKELTRKFQDYRKLVDRIAERCDKDVLTKEELDKCKEDIAAASLNYLDQCKATMAAMITSKISKPGRATKAKVRAPITAKGHYCVGSKAHCTCVDRLLTLPDFADYEMNTLDTFCYADPDTGLEKEVEVPSRLPPMPSRKKAPEARAFPEEFFESCVDKLRATKGCEGFPDDALQNFCDLGFEDCG